MLQVNSGSIWIGSKVMERIREESHSSQRKNFILKLTLDKVRHLAENGTKCTHEINIDFFLSFHLIFHLD